ncbi:MAG: hypothetical protein ACIAQF_04215 [Phycisphaerales bacterium JB065]
MTRTKIAAAVAVALGITGSASAGIAHYSGQISMIAPTEAPISFKWGDMANDEAMALYVETTGYTLESNLMADIPGNDGTYHRFARPAQPFAIPAGTKVDSYFIHQELVGNDYNKYSAMQFTITFEQPILGLILGGDWHDSSLYRSTLDDSDYLAGPGVLHAKNSDQRRRGALEGAAYAEYLTVSDDGYTLSGSLHSRSIHVDNLRVITMGSTIPTPGAVALFGLAGALGITRRRR